ncbi:hypothetical protein GCM10027591_05060 [Zhihengliuella somnathii]
MTATLREWSEIPQAAPPVYAEQAMVAQHVRPPGADDAVVLHGARGDWDVERPWTTTRLPVPVPAGTVPRASLPGPNGALALTVSARGDETARLLVVPAPQSSPQEVAGPAVRPGRFAWTDGGRSLIALGPDAPLRCDVDPARRMTDTLHALPFESPADMTEGLWSLGVGAHGVPLLIRRLHGDVTCWAWPGAGSTEWREVEVPRDAGGRLVTVLGRGLVLADAQTQRLRLHSWAGGPPRELPGDGLPLVAGLRGIDWSSTHAVLRVADAQRESLIRYDIRRLHTGHAGEAPEPIWRGEPGERVTALSLLPGGAAWWSSESPQHPCRIESFPAMPGPARSDPSQPPPQRRLRVEQQDVLVRDGARVGLQMAWPEETEKPCGILVTCYGGFGVAHGLEHGPAVSAWARLGGITAAAQVRGGGERGPRWHAAGSGAHKQTAVDDLVDCLRTLASEGVGDGPLPLVLAGASHGGWLAAMAALEVPELLAGVVLTAPLLDVVEMSRHGYGHHWENEFGQGSEPCLRRSLSPLHRLRELPADRSLPPFLVNVPQFDARIDTADAAEWCSEVQWRGAEAHLRTEAGGHTGNGRSHADQRTEAVLMSAARWCAKSARNSRRAVRLLR